MTSVGEQLDKDTSHRVEVAKQRKENIMRGVYDLGIYFKEMRQLEWKTSPRVRLLLQNVMKLRDNNWGNGK